MRLIFPLNIQFFSIPIFRLILLQYTLIYSAFAATKQWNFEPNRQQLNDEQNPILQQPRKSYRGFKLLRINPQSEDQLEWLRRLHQSDSNSPPPFFNLDFWQPPSQLGALIDLTVSPNDAEVFFSELRQRNIDYFVMNDDLEELIERERTGIEQLNRNEGGTAVTDGFRDDGLKIGSKEGGNEPEYRYDRYNPLSRIEEQLFRLREQNPRILTLFEIGKSHENRSIVTAKISAREHTSDERWHPFRGSAIWIDAGIHAREWIAPATAMLLLSKLVNGYNSADMNIRYLVESIDWYITPVMNPDGYEYSHTKNRMWRKNRRPAFCKQQYFNRICCSGVDLNRNFDWFWSITGSSSDPCHETYHGPSAFSEPESRAVREFLEEHPVKAFISLHSYSQFWLIPYGHKRRNYPEDYHTVQRPLSLRAVKALQRLYGTEYQVGSGADLLYEASGSSHDFAKGILNIPFSFLVELRPQNTLHSTGFLLPEAEIADTADETWEAIKVVADKVLERFAPFIDGRKTWKGSTKSENGSIEMSSTTTKSLIKESTEELSSTSSSTQKTKITTTTAQKKTTMLKNNSPKARPTTAMAKTLTSTQKTIKQQKTTMASSTESSIRSTSHYRHTFLPNTITTEGGEEETMERSSTPSALTSKSLPIATTLVAPLSVRNSATKTGSSRGGGSSSSAGGGKSTSSAEKGEIPSTNGGNGSELGSRKTIVNVKICTGGKELLKGLPFPSGESSSSRIDEEEEEIGEEDKELLPAPQSTSRRRLIKCRDWSSYCKWWRMHSLCADPRVRKMCTLSCLIECQI